MKPKLSSSRKWFEGDFVDSKAIDDWATKNEHLMSTAQYFISTEQATASSSLLSLFQSSASPPPALLQDSPKVTLPIKIPKTTSKQKKTDEKPSKKKQNRQKYTTDSPCQKTTPLQPEKKKQKMSDSDTEDEKIQETKQKSKSKAKLNVSDDHFATKHAAWWNESACNLMMPFLEDFPKSDVGTCEISFHGQRVLFLRTFYYLKKMPDGSAVGNASMCAQVSFYQRYLCLICSSRCENQGPRAATKLLLFLSTASAQQKKITKSMSNLFLECFGFAL